MNRFMKLVNFELGRFMKIYLVLITTTIVVQIVGVIVKANAYLSEANRAINEEMMPRSQFIAENGTMDFLSFTQSLWFIGPIALGAVTLIIYIFMIWYRDWFGKNTFIYRLLMLPTARFNVYLAKATAILLMVLGLVSIQLLLLPIENTVLEWRIPVDFMTPMSINGVIAQSGYLGMLFPQEFILFILTYGAGFMSVVILFTAILFERSYKWKGILLGAGYGALSVAVFAFPVLLDVIWNIEYLYPLELLATEITLGIIVMAGAIWIGRFLLNKKVTV